MSDTVTLNRSHFEALLRRAEFYSADTQYLPNFHLENISISKDEYGSLLQSEKELQSLKTALLGGGITPETLDTLIQTHSEQARKDSASAPGAWTEIPNSTSTPAPYIYTSDSANDELVSNVVGAAHDLSWQQTLLQVSQQDLAWQQRQDFGERPCSPVSFDDQATDHEHGRTVDSWVTHIDPCTLLIAGLTERITYKDLTNVIRGGRISYITIRGDKTATVCMLEGAADFLAHVKRHDLYVQTKRSARGKMNDYQFKLAPYVGRKIANGASRNLVLRNAVRVVNIADIREHMEHIHKFKIIDIVTRGNDVFVYTNSVHNALFARTCMISRQPYKGLRIEFFPDECAAPLPMIRSSSGRMHESSMKSQTVGNLFEMLSLDSDEENRFPGREDDDDNTIDGHESDFGVRLV